MNLSSRVINVYIHCLIIEISINIVLEFSQRGRTLDWNVDISVLWDTVFAFSDVYVVESHHIKVPPSIFIQLSDNYLFVYM